MTALLDEDMGLALFVRPRTARVAIFMCLSTVGYLIAGRIEYVKGLRRQASPVNRPTAAEGAKSLVS